MTARILSALGGADLEVAADFGAGYIDITEYVQVNDMLPVVRGRTNESSTSEPMRLTFTLDNSDGRFTPSNPDSPYWPGCRFRTPVRVRVRHPHTSGSWFTRFTGFVDEWPTGYPSMRTTVALSQVSASGQMRRLLQGGPLRSGIGDRAAMNAASGSLIGYWPLTDGADATRFGKAAGLSTVGDLNRSPLGVSNAAVAGPDGDPTPVAEFTFADGAGYLVSAAAGTQLPSVVGQTVEVWWRWGHAAIDLRLNSPQYAIRLEQSEPSALVWQIKATMWNTAADPDVVIAEITGAALTAAQVGDWVHTVLTFDNGVGSSWDLALYTNGVADGTDSAAVTSTSLLTSVYAYDRSSTQADDGPTAIGHLHLYTGVLSSTVVADHYQIGTGYVGELASDRVIRVCGDAGLTVDATAALGAALGPQPVASLLGVLRDSETADRGFLYEALDGDLAFQAVSQRYNPATYLSLSAQAEVVNELSPVADDQDYANEATASRPQGSSATFTDEDAVDTYGEYHKDVTVNVAEDAQLYPVASAVVGASSDPSLPRFPGLGFRFAQSEDSSKLTAWLAGEPLGSLLALTSLPSQLPDSSASLFVEGYTETWGYAICQVIANCSNADPFTRIFTIEGAAPLGTIGMSGQTVGTGINASATSLSVATAAGESLLSTAGGDYPVVLLNKATGERFTVTACSGGSSPQTLTITRGSESTTAKAMTVGDVLDVAHPALLAL